MVIIMMIDKLTDSKFYNKPQDEMICDFYKVITIAKNKL